MTRTQVINIFFCTLVLTVAALLLIKQAPVTKPAVPEDIPNMMNATANMNHESCAAGESIMIVNPNSIHEGCMQHFD